MAPREGAVQGLSRNMMISLIEFARKDYGKARKLDAEVLQQHNAYWVAKRKASRAEGFHKLVAKYVDTLAYWDKRQGRKLNMREVNHELMRVSGNGKKVAYLNNAIHVRVIPLD